jgi:hypothetical protein
LLGTIRIGKGPSPSGELLGRVLEGAFVEQQTSGSYCLQLLREPSHRGEGSAGGAPERNYEIAGGYPLEVTAVLDEDDALEPVEEEVDRDPPAREE